MRNTFVIVLALGLFACGENPKTTPKEEPKKAPASTPVSTPAPVASAPTSAPAPAAANEVKVSLKATELPTIPDSDAPRSKITLTITESGKPPVVQEIGEFLGCGSSTIEVDPKALIGIGCFWAGGGDAFNLYQEKDALVLKYTATDEGMEGKPTPVEKFRHPLPPGATVKKEE